jgi:PAS domain-containing protein
MNASSSIEWNERGNANGGSPADPESMFHLLFERTADAIWLVDPGTATIVDCNEASVALMRCSSRADLIGKRGEDLSPPVQPDGSLTGEAAARRIAETPKSGNSRFEWTARHRPHPAAIGRHDRGAEPIGSRHGRDGAAADLLPGRCRLEKPRQNGCYFSRAASGSKGAAGEGPHTA